MKWIREFMVRVILVAVMVLISASAVAQNIERIGAMATGFPTAMAFRGNYIYIAASGLGLRVIDFSNPEHPFLAGSFSGVTSSAQSIALYENYAILGCRYGMMVVDVSDLSNLHLVGNYDFAYPLSNYFGDIGVYGGYLYAVLPGNYNTYITVFDLSDPSNIHPDTFIEKNMCAPISFTISGRYMYAYSWESCSNNLGIYDLIEPLNPTQISELDIPNPSWTISLDNGIMYYYARTGFMAFDVSTPLNPSLLCDLDTGPETYYQYFGRFALCAADSFVYRIGGDSKLRAFDVADPYNPRLAGIVNSLGASSVYAINDTIYMASIDSLWIYRVISHETGTISGEVKDATTLAPIPGVIVNLWPYGIIDTTDALGLYEYDGLYGFNYILSFSHPEYFPLADSGIPAVPNQIRDHDVILQHRLVKDVAVTSLFTPTWFLSSESIREIQPIVTNLGTAEQSFTVNCQIYYRNGTIPINSASVMVSNLPSQETDTINMGIELENPDDTLYEIITYSTLDGDENKSNDTCRVLPFPESRGDVAFYFGNPDGSPLIGEIGKHMTIDLYCTGKPGMSIYAVYAGLGAPNSYIDTFLSINSYGPTSVWSDFYYDTRSNDSGWALACLFGGDEMGSTFLSSQQPLKIAEYIGVINNDSSIMDSTFYCLRRDCNTSEYGVYSNPSVLHSATAYFSPIHIAGTPQNCDYMLGDINNDNSVGGADVTYGVRYFKGYGPAPSDSCWDNRDLKWLYSAGDVNGNCDFKGSDISRLVAYFKSTAQIEYCPNTPPASRLRLKR
jgi:hypothetical protein